MVKYLSDQHLLSHTHSVPDNLLCLVRLTLIIRILFNLMNITKLIDLSAQSRSDDVLLTWHIVLAYYQSNCILNRFWQVRIIMVRGFCVQACVKKSEKLNYHLPKATLQMRQAAANEPADAPAILFTHKCRAYSWNAEITPTWYRPRKPHPDRLRW